MKAIIVAAGQSSRLYPLTRETPKGLLPVGGRGMLERSVALLHAQGIEEIVVVVGFCHEKIRQALRGRVRFVLNPFFRQTNNMGSLWLAMPHVQGEEIVYLHGDVVYHEALLARLVEGASDGIRLLVDGDSIDEEAMKVRVEDGHFAESSKAIPPGEAVGEWTGLARFSPAAAAALYDCIETLLADEAQWQSYDTAAFNRLAQSGMAFSLVPTNGLPWREIDTLADLEHARALFAETKYEV